MNGVVVLDKPPGWTSHDAVNKVRRLADTTKVGHLGTLDPMATGVLPLVIGRATRLAQFVAPGRKSYEATIRFGFATDSYDADGEPTGPPTAIRLDRAAVEDWLRPFAGRILQTPPAVSAKKIGGVPAYELARKKVEVVLTPVEVEIFSLNILEMGDDSLQIRVECGPGTYIRSIAHDLGQRAGCGAHLTALRRLLSSGFGIERSHTMEELKTLKDQGRFDTAVIPAAELLPEWPSETIDYATEQQIRQGRDFRVSPFRGLQSARYVKAVSPAGELIAIGEAKMPLVYHPTVVL
jgi:tRNA pseudouridine55 synthase